MKKETAYQLKPAIGYQVVKGGSEDISNRTFRWDGHPARAVRKGEFYLSGAIPEAWQAPNDLDQPFFICHETRQG